MREIRNSSAADFVKQSVVALGAGLIFLITLIALPGPAPTPKAQPRVDRGDEFSGASACQSCHPKEHASWTESYHATMTRRVASLFSGTKKHAPLPFPAQLSLDGRTYLLEQKGQRLFYRGPDLHEVGRTLAQLSGQGPVSKEQGQNIFSEAKEVEGEVALLTGSHHYIAFWLARKSTEELRQIPFVFLLDEKRFIPRREAFLQPSDSAPRVPRFNANCIQCHTVQGKPRQTEGTDDATGAFWERYDSEVVDFGIACESCHGAGKAHIEHYKNPWARFSSRHGLQQVPSAARLYVPKDSHPKSGSAVCGQCHSYFLPRDPDAWWDSGFASNYQVGDSLAASRDILTRERLLDDESLPLAAHVASLFWADGSMMVGGREFNGLLKSPCFDKDGLEGSLSCVSCHSMHAGAPSGQIAPKYAGSIDAQNQMCQDCHKTSPPHSGHLPASIGSRCVSCHMPKTSYALLSGITSHRIITPMIPAEKESRAATGVVPPHPCVLCHTDKPRLWVIQEMRRMWPGLSVDSYLDAPTDSPSAPYAEDGEIPPKSEQNLAEDQNLPWALHLAVSGNAAERAVVLSALSSRDAQTTAGRGPLLSVLETLEHDDYAAIAHMARRAKLELDAAQEKETSNSAPIVLPLSRWQMERDTTPVTISE